jgi:hypothetical protein
VRIYISASAAIVVCSYRPGGESIKAMATGHSEWHVSTGHGMSLARWLPVSLSVKM